MSAHICMHMHACTHKFTLIYRCFKVHVKVRVQLAQANSLLLPGGSWGLKSDPKAWVSLLSPTEPPYEPQTTGFLWSLSDPKVHDPISRPLRGCLALWWASLPSSSPTGELSCANLFPHPDLCLRPWWPHIYNRSRETRLWSGARQSR